MTELSNFGKRWNKKSPGVAFDPNDNELVQGEVSTGLESVDAMLGGGFPRGRTSMLYGAESCGKTLLVQYAMAAIQKKGGVCVYMDVERTYTPRWFELTGVQLNDKQLLILRPKSMEQAFDMTCDMLENLQPDILCIDSLPALVPQKMMDADMEAQDFIGLSARKTTEGVKKATQHNTSTAFIIINQIRVVIGATPHQRPDMFPGGKNLRHACTAIVFMRRGEWLTDAIDDTDSDDMEEMIGNLEKPVTYANRTGFQMKMRVEKNKYGTPWKEADAKVFFNGTVDEIAALVGTLRARGVVTGSRGFYHVPGVEGTIRGWEKLEELIRSDPELRATLRDKVS